MCCSWFFRGAPVWRPGSLLQSRLANRVSIRHWTLRRSFMESAYRAYAQERYPLASALFQRFVDSNPDSPRLSEARWWLARSYERAGDLPAALSAYRAVVGVAPRSTSLTGSYEFHALNRLDAFRRSLDSSSLLESGKLRFGSRQQTGSQFLISDYGLRNLLRQE